MSRTVNDGIDMLTALARELKLITPEEFQPPSMRVPKRRRVVGEATDYHKALVTLQNRLHTAHRNLHREEDMRFGGHIGLSVRHEFLHAAPDILETLLTSSLTNTFKELSDDVLYYISPDWKVCVEKKPIGSRK